MSKKITITAVKIINAFYVELLLIFITSIIPTGYLAIKSDSQSTLLKSLDSFLTDEFLIYYSSFLALVYALFSFIRYLYRNSKTNFISYILNQSCSGLISAYRLLIGPFIFASAYELLSKHNKESLVLFIFSLLFLFVCIVLNVISKSISEINNEKTI